MSHRVTPTRHRGTVARPSASTSPTAPPVLAARRAVFLAFSSGYKFDVGLSWLRFTRPTCEPSCSRGEEQKADLGQSEKLHGRSYHFQYLPIRLAKCGLEEPRHGLRSRDFGIDQEENMDRSSPRLFLCAGLQCSGSTLVSWCFLQRRDMDGVLDGEYDLLPRIAPLWADRWLGARPPSVLFACAN